MKVAVAAVLIWIGSSGRARWTLGPLLSFSRSPGSCEFDLGVFAARVSQRQHFAGGLSSAISGRTSPTRSPSRSWGGRQLTATFFNVVIPGNVGGDARQGALRRARVCARRSAPRFS